MWNTVKSYHEFPISLCFFFHVNSSNSSWLVQWKIGWEAKAFRCRSSGDKMCSKQEKKINMFPRCFKTQVSPIKSKKNYENSIQRLFKENTKGVCNVWMFPVNHIGMTPRWNRPQTIVVRALLMFDWIWVWDQYLDSWRMVGIPHAGWPPISRGNDLKMG